MGMPLQIHYYANSANSVFISRQNFDFQVTGSIEIIVCQYREVPTRANT